MKKDNEKKRNEAMLEFRSALARSCSNFAELNEHEMDSIELTAAMMSVLTSFIAEVAVKANIKAKTVLNATEQALKLHQLVGEMFSDDT